MIRFLPKLILLFTVLLVVSVGCAGDIISEESLLKGIESVNRFLDSPWVSSLPRIVPIVLIVLAVGLLIFARGVFFRIHSALLAGILLAGALGILAGLIGFVGSYASIFAVNKYFESLIGLSNGTVVTALGGALVGVIGMIAALFGAVIVFFLFGALGSIFTGSSINIPIVDRWGLPSGFSLRIWTPGDIDGAEEGGMGCMAALSPGILVAPIVGAYAAIRLQNGPSLEVSNTSFIVAIICCLLVGVIALLSGLRAGWVAGGDKFFGGAIVGAIYGFIVVRTFGDDLGLNYPTFLRIVTYILGIVAFASVGYFLSPDDPNEEVGVIFYIFLVTTLLVFFSAFVLWFMNEMEWIW